jgi:hypothetical protein
MNRGKKYRQDHISFYRKLSISEALLNAAPNIFFSKLLPNTARTATQFMVMSVRVVLPFL